MPNNRNHRARRAYRKKHQHELTKNTTDTTTLHPKPGWFSSLKSWTWSAVTGVTETVALPNTVPIISSAAKSITMLSQLVPTTAQLQNITFITPLNASLQLSFYNNIADTLTGIIEQCKGIIIDDPGKFASMVKTFCDNTTLAPLGDVPSNLTFDETGQCFITNYNEQYCTDSTPPTLDKSIRITIAVILSIGLCLGCCKKLRETLNKWEEQQAIKQEAAYIIPLPEGADIDSPEVQGAINAQYLAMTNK